MTFDAIAIEGMAKHYRAQFINSLSGFKSANLIGTVNAEGRTNLCIVSSVFHLGADPPLMGMISRPHTTRRDTLENIIQNGQFTINHVNDRIWQQAHQTSARYLANQSEFDVTALTPESLPGFEAPFVQEAHVKIGLHCVERQEMRNQTVLIIGEVVQVHVPESAITTDGHIDIESVATVAVSGLDRYHSTDTLARLTYAKPDRQPQPMATQERI